MSDDRNGHISRREWLTGSALLLAGAAISAVAVHQIMTEPVAMVQIVDTTKPPATIAPVGKGDGVAESMSGGVRPTTPAPEPARPSGTVGSGPLTTQDRSPVAGNPLPPALAEQHDEPIKPK